MKRIYGLPLLIFLVSVMVPSCCHTESRESPTETAPSPTRMRSEYRRALKDHREKDYFYKKYREMDSEDADE